MIKVMKTAICSFLITSLQNSCLIVNTNCMFKRNARKEHIDLLVVPTLFHFTSLQDKTLKFAFFPHFYCLVLGRLVALVFQQPLHEFCFIQILLVCGIELFCSANSRDTKAAQQITQ